MHLYSKGAPLGSIMSLKDPLICRGQRSDYWPCIHKQDACILASNNAHFRVHWKNVNRKWGNIQMSPHRWLFAHTPPCSVLFPPITILITQKTHVSSGLSTAHTHRDRASCWMHEQSKEGKLNYKCHSASNIGSHDTLLSVSQWEAVISLAPNCMCATTADTLFDEKQCAVGWVCVCV